MFKPISTWPNLYFLQFFSCELGQIMTRYDFLEARRVILRNVRTDSRLQPDFNFGQLVRWIGANNGQVWLCRCEWFEQYLNWLQLDLILILINFSYEFRQIMTRYDFLELRWVILCNVRTQYNLTWFYFCSTYELGKIMCSWMLAL